MKKCLSLILSVLMVMGTVSAVISGTSVLSFATAKPTSGKCGETLTWQYNTSTKTLTISGTGEMNNFNILNGTFASVIDEPIEKIIVSEGVTSIGNYAFISCADLTSVTIADSVKEIGANAFAACSELKSIVIPYGVLTISERVFGACKKLENIVIPDSVINIGYYAFYGCSSLESINIPDSVAYIGDYAFQNCIKLRNINIPENVTSIGKKVFAGCIELTSLTIPDSITTIDDSAFSESGLINITIPGSVTKIGKGAFSYCQNLKSIEVDKNNSVFHSAGNCIIQTTYKALVAGCKNSVIPDDGSVTSIEESAFRGCTELTYITIPYDITTIYSYAFFGCTGLKNITLPRSVNFLGYYVFGNCSGLESIEVETNNAKYRSSGNCLIDISSKKIIAGCKNSVIPDDGSVTSIGEYSFDGCSELKTLYIPGIITTINSYAFRNCTGLTSITFLEGVKDIDSYAFVGCTGLTTVIMSDSVKEIGERAFQRCTDLSNVQLSNGLTYIDNYAFEDCTGLSSVVLPKNLTKISNGTFSGCTGLRSVSIPDSVDTIGEWAFSRCESLESVNFPSGVTRINNFVFSGCTGLSSITIEENSTYHCAGNCIIETDSKTLIAGCKNSIIPDDGSVTSIGYGAFTSISSLSNIFIPEGVTSINKYAFQDCTGLISISIPLSVKTIGEGAFRRSPGIKDVYYAGTEKQWEEISVNMNEYGNDYLLDAVIHYSSTGPTGNPDDPDNPNPGDKKVVSQTPDGVVLYDDNSAVLPNGRTVENAIDIRFKGNRVNFNLTRLTPQQNEGFNAIKYGCNARFDLSLANPDGTSVSKENPAVIRFKKDFVGRDINTIGIFHFPQSGLRESFTATRNEPDFRIYDDGEYWKITVTSLSPFGIYYLPALNVKASQTVDYKANVTVTATAENVPEGYALAIYEGNALKAKGNASSVRYKAGTMTANRTFIVKIIDDGNNALKDVEENEIKSNCEVKVKTGFFDKLIAFFKGLFGALPNVEVKP